MPTPDHPLARFERSLAGLARKDRLRSLGPAVGLDFTSNDYLGLAADPRLAAAVADALARGVPVGAGGSRLLRGNHPEHEALEAEAAAFFGAKRALFFGGGFNANLALVSTLPQKGDLVLFDALVHASAHEGMAAGRAECAAFPHNDVDAAAAEIARWRAGGGLGRVWLVAESVYSMDGDVAPVADLLALADRAEGFLILDEAHATGVLGPGGRGVAAAFEGRENLVVLHTCGKALGVSGGLVTADPVLCDYLVNRARAFIYATAPSPLVAAAVRAALRILADEPERISRLARLVAFAGEGFSRLGVTPSGTPIQPVIVHDNARAVRLAARMQTAGFDLRAIRPPTVPEGSARLRVALTLNVGEAEVTAMLAALAEGLRAEGVVPGDGVA